MSRKATPASRRKVHLLFVASLMTACGRGAEDPAVAGFTTSELTEVTCKMCLQSL